jgi:ribosomal protein S18 acetylase RimI-like enzyme
MSDPSAVIVRELDPASDAGWARQALNEAFGGQFQARRGVVHDVLRLPGLIAELHGQPIGLLLHDPDDGRGEAELAALATPVRGAGGGTALVRALAARIPDRPIWLVTTNDNLDALRFYQREGYRLRTLRAGAVDEARRTLKPEIPLGIPLRDELELVRLPGRNLEPR